MAKLRHARPKGIGRHLFARQLRDKRLLRKLDRADLRSKRARPRKTVGPTEDPVLALGQPDSLVIGVMGGAGSQLSRSQRLKAARLGAAIADEGQTILTGAAPGLPHLSVLAAQTRGGKAIGISPWESVNDHLDSGAPANFDVLKLTYHPALRGQRRPNYMGREIDNIEHSDIVLVMGGRFGTLGELAIALDERKVVGVLTGTGGVSDEARRIVRASTRAGKPPGAPVIFDSNPERLVRRTIQAKRDFDRTNTRTGPLGDGD